MLSLKGFMLFVIIATGYFVPVCIAQTDKVLSGRDLLRALRDKDENEKFDGIPGKETSPSVVDPDLTGKTTSQSRVLHFPSDRSLGMLKIQDAGIVRQIKTFHCWIDGANWYDNAEYLCEAQGDVTVPAGKRLALVVNKAAWRDLSPLSELRPNDLYRLIMFGSLLEPDKPDDRCMPHIAGLTGLKVLSLSGTNISSKGLRYIKDFKKLERLYPPDRITNAGMAVVAELHSLKGLYFIIVNRVTNADLRHLSKLTSLEELALGGVKNDAGLVHLAKLKSLNYLALFGSDAGMAHLKDIPNLRILNIGLPGPITDEGLANLTGCKQLERISLHWNENITDKGASYLATMPSLKMIDLSHAHITDAGLAHLAKIKSLELLNGIAVTDTTLVHLAELKKLRNLNFKGSDAGLAQLAKLNLPLLEELWIAGLGVTDAGMSHVAKLTNLKKLTLFGCPITNKGLAKLKALKSLEYLWLYNTQNITITISDLKDLNALPNLVELQVQEIIQDNSGLDISGLTRLEKLRIRTHHKGDSIRDEDLACLAKLKQLKWLQLGPTKLTDVGMTYLAELINIERINIGGLHLTDDGLTYLAKMNKLDNLTITDGNLTNKGLRHLEGLKALTHLNITSQSAFSKAAMGRLRKNLPNLHTFNINRSKESKRAKDKGNAKH